MWNILAWFGWGYSIDNKPLNTDEKLLIQKNAVKKIETLYLTYKNKLIKKKLLLDNLKLAKLNFNKVELNSTLISKLRPLKLKKRRKRKRRDILRKEYPQTLI